MNIAYLTQITNLEISDKNPLDYIKDYDQNPDFEEVIESHMLPTKLIEWSRFDEMPENALDQFIERRVDIIIDELRDILQGVNFEVIDTKEKEIEEIENAS